MCAVDNGLDQVKIYRVDYTYGKLKLVDIIRGPLESAPRMIRFSRDGKYAYILYELTHEIEVYKYSVENEQHSLIRSRRSQHRERKRKISVPHPVWRSLRAENISLFPMPV